MIRHKANDSWPAHYQHTATEYNLVIKGRISIRLNDTDHIFNDGDIFVIEPKEITLPTFLTDCEIMVVKVPSSPFDKAYAI